MATAFKPETLTIDNIWANHIENDDIIRVIDANKNAIEVDGVMGIDWFCNLGFGTYTFYFNKDGCIFADSEHMDINTNKTFLTALMKKFIEQVEVIG